MVIPQIPNDSRFLKYEFVFCISHVSTAAVKCHGQKQLADELILVYNFKGPDSHTSGQDLTAGAGS